MVKTQKRQNCWEFKKCGREVGGVAADKLGVCPVAIDHSATGLNHGERGGRICWAITGTLSGCKVRGTFAKQRISCESCDFFMATKEEEGKHFALLRPSQLRAG